MYLADPIERGEIAAERWYGENVTDDKFICCCGRETNLDDAHPMSPDPYAPPICGLCLEASLISKLKHEGWRIVRSADRKRALRKKGVYCQWVPFVDCWKWMP